MLDLPQAENGDQPAAMVGQMGGADHEAQEMQGLAEEVGAGHETDAGEDMVYEYKFCVWGCLSAGAFALHVFSVHERLCASTLFLNLFVSCGCFRVWCAIAEFFI